MKFGNTGLAVLILAVSLSAASCADQPPIIAEINGFAPQAMGDAGDKHYFMLPASKDVSPTDLEFEEYSRYVSRALTQHGYVPAQGLADADVVIFIGYGIGDPRDNQYSYSIPLYGQTGIQS